MFEQLIIELVAAIVKYGEQAIITDAPVVLDAARLAALAKAKAWLPMAEHMEVTLKDAATVKKYGQGKLVAQFEDSATVLWIACLKEEIVLLSQPLPTQITLVPPTEG